MTSYEKVQQYTDRLLQRIGQLPEERQAVAQPIVKLLELTYYSVEDEAYQQLVSLLSDRAQGHEDFSAYFKPLLEACALLENEPLRDCFRYITEQAVRLPYSTSYGRKPYRTTAVEPHIQRVVRKLVELFRMELHQFSLPDYLQHKGTANDYQYEIRNVLPDCIAHALDSGDEQTMQALREIIYGDNQTALLSNEMIKGMLMSNQKSAYQMIGELLVAARLQEGLRQSIVERMDEGTLEAFIYMLQVIIDHNLIRFSAVVRGLAVWTGLGIEAAQQRVTSQLIVQAHQALTNPQSRASWLQEGNANKLFLALWAIAVEEERHAAEPIARLMNDGEIYQQVVAQYVLANSENSSLRLHSARRHLDVADAELIHWIVRNYDASYSWNWQFIDGKHEKQLQLIPLPELADKAERRRDFDLFHNMLLQLPAGGAGGPSRVLDFVHYQIGHDDIVRKMLYLAAYDMDTTWIAEVIGLKHLLSSELRGELLSQFVQQPDNPAQRQFILDSLSDKSIPVREQALVKASALALTRDELEQLAALLKLKTGSLRQKVIQVMLTQPSELLAASLELLLHAKSELQRLGALELLTEIASDPERSEQYTLLKPLAERIASPTAKEKQLLEKLAQMDSAYTAANGFGLFDPSRTSPLLAEKRDLAGFTPQDAFTLQLDKAARILNELDALVHEHRDVEYKVEYYSGYTDTLLIGTRLAQTVPYAQRQSLPMLEQFPLHSVWQAYFQQSELDSLELMQLHYIVQLPDLSKTLDHFFGLYRDRYEYEQLRRTPLLEGWRKDFIAQIYPLDDIAELKERIEQLRYSSQVQELLNAAYMDTPKADTFAVSERVWAAVVAAMPADRLESDAGLLQLLARQWITISQSRMHDDDSFRRFFQSAYQYSALFGEKDHSPILTLADYLRAYKLRLIDEQEIYYQVMLGRDRFRLLRELTSPRAEGIAGDAELVHVRNTAASRIVEIERGRGELSTEVSLLAMKLEQIEGMEHWVHLVSAMDQDSFVRGYIYSYGGQTTRKETFSYLIKHCHPAAGEDEQLLSRLLQQYPVPEKKLLEAAMYAPQWLELVAKHLGWPGLRSAAWYFHAHINESFSAEKETIVAHYSPISPQEFNDGAFDIAWFEEAYTAVGEERFHLLYDCAKYISGGANHRRSQLFADAVLGKLELEELRQSVEAKRNKDHLLTYGLIPLAADADRDLRERYAFIQKFLLQSKQYGAQRRASESVAAQIALGNLARNAGYADITRMMWHLEANKLDEVAPYLADMEIESGLKVRLEIDSEGQSSIVAIKNDKPLKSLPSRLNKHEHVVRLKELKTELTEQYRRARQELERCMAAGTSFTADELIRLAPNPVLAPLLQSLVFRCGETLGYLNAGQRSLHSLQAGEDGAHIVERALKETDLLQIAHPLHLYESGNWLLYQRAAMEAQFHPEQRQLAAPRTQPFRQLFRELYLPNADELESGTVSRRYAGHQVQPKKTVALLRERQWTVSYEDGLQKVSYEHNLIASLYAMADWFSPADTEAPTLEAIQFYNRKTYKLVALKDVPPLFFSEVMRDIDLVVSIAHVGGVDPEASLTTVEMRRVILHEALRLLKLDNVRLDGNYARIAGSLGEYAVHLGSGNTFKQAAGALHILPVHSQHRGRILLPFLDEDPRTAEILSKVALLAEDHKIKDPQIAAQLA